MKILVLIKQVPDTAEIKTDPVRGTLIRDGAESIMNPYDGYALEAAARIKDDDPGTEITVLSMGPASAEAVLKEAISIAADRAYLLCDSVFAGSDTYATSHILFNGIRKIEETEGAFDAVFCGRQATDGDTAQVGPELAEWLGIPRITCALRAEFKGGRIRAEKQTEKGTVLTEAELPALLTFTKPSWEPRHPSLKRKLAAKKAEITVLKADDLPELDRTKAGLAGSPTRVKRTFVPGNGKAGIIIKEETDRESAAALFRLMTERGLLE